METTEPQTTEIIQAPPKRKSLLSWLIIALVLLVAIGVVAYRVLNKANSYPADLAAVAPPESLVYLSLDLRPVMARQKEFEPTVKAWQESALVKQLQGELESELGAQGLNLKEDILSWAGPTMAVAILDLPGVGMPNLAKPGKAEASPLPFPADMMRAPSFIAFFTARDGKKARQSLAKIVEKSGTARQTETYQGAEISQLSQPAHFAYAVDGGLVILGNKIETIKAALDRYHGKGPSLAQEQNYQKLLAALSGPPKERLLLYYLNPKLMEKMLAESSLFAGAGPSMTEMQYVDTAGGALNLTPTTVSLEGLSLGSKAAQSPTRKLLASLPPVGGRAFEFLPKSSVLAMALPSPATYWQVLKQALASPKSKASPFDFDLLGEIKQGLKKDTGLDLEQDILGWMTGEFTFGIFGANASAMTGGPGALPIQVSLIITGKDEATVKAKIDYLRPVLVNILLKQIGMEPIWQARKTGAVNYYALNLPGVPIAPCLGQVGKLAIVSLTPQGFEQTVKAGLDAQQSITTNAAYLRLKKLLPRQPSSLFFAEPAALNKEFGNIPPLNMLGAFKTIVGGDEFLPQGTRSTLHMEVDFPQLIKAADSLSQVFNQSRGQAAAASCLSNVKQINLGLLMFADDHDERLPDAAHWVDEIMPYVQNKKIFKCPEDKSGARSSYAFNAALSGVSFKNIKQPADLVMVFETKQPGKNPSGGPGSVLARHNNGLDAVYGFADGHVKMDQKAQNFNPNK